VTKLTLKAEPFSVLAGVYPNPELADLLKNLVPDVGPCEGVLVAIAQQAKIRRWRKARVPTHLERKERCS
jgi:hypothetical protein